MITAALLGLLAVCAILVALLVVSETGRCSDRVRLWTKFFLTASGLGCCALVILGTVQSGLLPAEHIGRAISVMLIGAVVGAVEILSRYRDEPWIALRAPMALAYMFINAFASLFCYALLQTFDLNAELTLGQGDEAGTVMNEFGRSVLQVMIAGFSAMAFFRSALFTARVNGNDIAVGPGLIFQALLNATDRSVDRERAIPRATRIPKLMASVDFEKASLALTAFCFGSMQNVSAAEQLSLREQIATISDQKTMERSVKSHLLGLLLVNLVGFRVLEEALKSLGDEITYGPQGLAGHPTQPANAGSASANQSDAGAQVS